MTDEEVERVVEAEVARVATLARRLIQRWVTAPGCENMQVTVPMVVCVFQWNTYDEEGEHEREDVAFACESKKHHVQTGILNDALRIQERRRSS